MSSVRGLEIVSGRPAELGGTVVAARSGPGVIAAIAPAGLEDSVVTMRVVDGTHQGVLPGAPATLRSGASRRLAIPEAEKSRAAALVVDVSIGSPVAAGVSWDWAGSPPDEVITPLVSVGRRWRGVVGSPFAKTLIQALVVNLADKPAGVRVDLFGTRTSSLTRRVPPGRLTVLTLSESAATLGMNVSSDQPIAVVLQVAARGAGGSTLAYGIPASPVVRPRPVAVVADPRVGIPARIPTV